MSMIGFPLLLIPFAVVNIIAFLMPEVSLNATLFTVPLPSGQPWTLTFSDALLALAMLLLFFEVMKAARPGAKYFTDHLLSLIVFGGAAAEFLLLQKPQFATSTFFLLTVLAFVDFCAGVAVRARRSKLPRAAPQPAAEQPVPAPAYVPPPPVPMTSAPTVIHPVAPSEAAAREAAFDHPLRPTEIDSVPLQEPIQVEPMPQPAHETAAPEAHAPAIEPPRR